MTNPSLLPELVRDFKLEATTFRGDLTTHTRPLGRRGRTETWKRGELLGHGGYGVVLLEHRLGANEAADGVGPSPQHRAVKMVRAHNQGPIHYVRELEALSKFSQDKYSEFFVKFLGWYESPKYLHIAMEYCPHGDLKKYLSQNGGSLPENEVRAIAFQVLAGVVMMHRAGFANRDIKPANILINSKPPQEWWVKICDFGLSRRAEDFSSGSTTVKGTPAFMPPELLGFHVVGTQGINAFMIDMWCLGETVFQALTGQPVFGMPATVGSYSQGTSKFPIDVLRRVNASNGVISFIQALMMAHPGQRINSEQAVKHHWIQDIALGPTVSAPDRIQNNGIPSEWPLPSTRAPGDQLTQASGQWTTTMTFPNKPLTQHQQEQHGRGHASEFRPNPAGNFQPNAQVQRPYYNPPGYPHGPISAVPFPSHYQYQHILPQGYLSQYPYQHSPYFQHSFPVTPPFPGAPPFQPQRFPITRPNSDPPITVSKPPIASPEPGILDPFPPF